LSDVRTDGLFDGLELVEEKHDILADHATLDFLAEPQNANGINHFLVILSALVRIVHAEI
jgi:hypothetical protein